MVIDLNATAEQGLDRAAIRGRRTPGWTASGKRQAGRDKARRFGEASPCECALQFELQMT